MPLVIVGVFIAVFAGIAALSLRRFGAALFAVLLSPVLAALTYFFLGIYLARRTGHGHFYSFPFGALTVRDSTLLLSVAFWAVLWIVPLLPLGRALHRRIHAQRPTPQK